MKDFTSIWAWLCLKGYKSNMNSLQPTSVLLLYLKVATKWRKGRNKASSHTSYHFPSMMAGFQKSKDCFRLIGTIHASLYSLLKYHIDRTWSKVIWKLLNLLLIQVRPRISMLVDINTHWKRTSHIYCQGTKTCFQVRTANLFFFLVLILRKWCTGQLKKLNIHKYFPTMQKVLSVFYHSSPAWVPNTLLSSL